MSTPRVTVIGAGVVGLSTALQIQQLLPKATVTIVAAQFDRDTTSDGAAGIFRPNMDHIVGVSKELLTRWSRDSFQHYDKLAHSTQAKHAGISIMSGYHFYINTPAQIQSPYKDIVYDWRYCTPEELKIFPGTSKAHTAFKFTTLMIEGRWYLPYLMKKFKEAGGRVEQRTVLNLSEFSGQCEVLVNCTGLGSKFLVNDKLLVPNRGHMLRLKAPWVQHFVYVDNHSWIVPGMETVTVGGTRQIGDTDLGPREADREGIMQRACSVYPSLKEAEVAWEWVGLRPIRKPVRLETETIPMDDGNMLKVVHNYGHGGHGMALSWGCGKHAASLVHDMIASTTSRL